MAVDGPQSTFDASSSQECHLQIAFSTGNASDPISEKNEQSCRFPFSTMHLRHVSSPSETDPENESERFCWKKVILCTSLSAYDKDLAFLLHAVIVLPGSHIMHRILRNDFGTVGPIYDPEFEFVRIHFLDLFDLCNPPPAESCE